MAVQKLFIFVELNKWNTHAHTEWKVQQKTQVYNKII